MDAVRAMGMVGTVQVRGMSESDEEGEQGVHTPGERVSNKTGVWVCGGE